MATQENDYAGVLEDWKVNLIVSRARRFGFRRDELADILQELAMELLAFRFDETKANGASEMTAITALIDRQLAFTKRSQTRYERKLQMLEERVAANGSQIDSASLPTMELRWDVAEVLHQCSQFEQTVCRELATGDSQTEIARRLQITRRTLRTVVQQLRQRFRAHGCV